MSTVCNFCIRLLLQIVDKHFMPRKTKLTPDLQTNFLQALSVGATHRIACDYVGINQDTLYEWLKRGAAGRAPYADFSEQVQKAQGRAALGWLAKIEAAASGGNWQAAAWKLERRYPEEFGRTIQEHTGKGGGPMVLKVVYEKEPEPHA